MRNKVDAIIFDFGDTIATLNPSKETIVKSFLARKDVDISIEEIIYAYRIVGYSYKQSALKLKDSEKKRAFLFQLNIELLKVLGLAKRADLWKSELYDLFQAKKKWELYSDVLEVLAHFKRKGYKIAILANWDKNLKTIVKGLGIDQYFTQVLSSEEIHEEKPNPDAFFHILRLLSVSPEKATYVGNEYEVDVIGSRSAGLLSVLIDRNRFWSHADCLRIENLLELAEYFQ